MVAVLQEGPEWLLAPSGGGVRQHGDARR
eukprot:COSAG02_NODE_21502_length_785_cov_1.903790_1_plen_28_part_10